MHDEEDYWLEQGARIHYWHSCCCYGRTGKDWLRKGARIYYWQSCCCFGSTGEDYWLRRGAWINY